MDDNAKARYRQKMKDMKQKRTGGDDAPTPHATQEKALMDAFGEDAHALRLAHSLLQNKTGVLKTLSKTMAAASKAPEEPEDEEGLPPCKS